MAKRIFRNMVLTAILTILLAATVIVPSLYTAYENPNFECKTDGNTKGIVRASVGLLSYDEVLHAGGYPNKANDSYYLYNNTSFWTMSPAGFSGSNANEWNVNNTGNINNNNVNNTNRLRPDSCLNLV